MVNLCFFFIILGVWKKLFKQLQKTKQNCYAKSYRANLQTMWKAWFAFGIFFQKRFLPASAFMLSMYAVLLSRTFRSVKAIRNYISAVKTLHVLLDLPTNAFKSMKFSMTLKGLLRLNDRPPNRAYPITPSMLFEFHRFLNLKDPVEATFWCLFLVAFFSMSRKSNLVKTMSKNAPNKFLKRKDVSMSSNAITLSLHWSKTNQFAERIHKVPIIRITNSVLCPVQAMSNMLKLVPGKPGDPLFMLPNRKPVTYSEFMIFLKTIVSISGYDPKNFSTHSFRRGGATHAFRSNVPSELIKEHGDWSSDAWYSRLAQHVSTI